MLKYVNGGETLETPEGCFRYAVVLVSVDRSRIHHQRGDPFNVLCHSCTGGDAWDVKIRHIHSLQDYQPLQCWTLSLNLNRRGGMRVFWHIIVCDLLICVGHAHILLHRINLIEKGKRVQRHSRFCARN